jgi:hypothetical protein
MKIMQISKLIPFSVIFIVYGCGEQKELDNSEKKIKVR